MEATLDQFLSELRSVHPDIDYRWSKHKEASCHWIIDRVTDGSTGLDVGGTEYLCKELAKKKCRTTFFDFQKPENYPDSIQDDMLNVARHFEAESLDFITTRHTLEHSILPLYQLWCYNKLLKETGELFVIVPVHDKHWVWFETHHNCLPLDNWLMLFYRAGFRIIESDSGSWKPHKAHFIEHRFRLGIESRALRLDNSGVKRKQARRRQVSDPLDAGLDASVAPVVAESPRTARFATSSSPHQGTPTSDPPPGAHTEAKHNSVPSNAPLNFVLSNNPDYTKVQGHILGLIKEHLQPNEYQEHVKKPVPGCVNFSLFIRMPAEYLMSHGVADKNYFFKKWPDGQRMADRLKGAFVPGNWLKRRIVNNKRIHLGENDVHVVGWPRLDELLLLQANYDKQKSSSPPSTRKKVLWAPTHDFRHHGKDNATTSSYPALLPYIPKLEESFDVTMSLHPRNRGDKRPTIEKLIEADLVISDMGTMVYEAWALGKQVVFPSWLIGRLIADHMPHSAEGYIHGDRIGLHADSFDEMHDMLLTAPPFDDKLKAFLDDYIEPSYQGTSARRVAQLLRNLAAKAP